MATPTAVPATTAAHAHAHGHGKVGLPGLVVGALGVVFGDIGTSPLYTLKEAFSPHYGLTANHDTVLGILSLVFWALMIVVTLKYVTIIMRADNEGEGGIMALMALAQRTPAEGRRARPTSVGILGIFGASLFFGDGVITPAITVLGAVEGLEVAAPAAGRLDRADRRGDPGGAVRRPALRHREGGHACSGRSRWSGSSRIAAIGVHNIVDAPEVLKALNPWWAREVLHRPRLARAVHPRRGGAGGDRWRGAVRRHGPFRRAPDPLWPGTASCCRA